ncbi:hypothetical protein NXC24_PC00420 (plasmid) [Rhizobium sp. NXC24]|nr:hypothetical protein NXC24_PC00420 [Rhizobium sp. NXC24]
MVSPGRRDNRRRHHSGRACLVQVRSGAATIITRFGNPARVLIDPGLAFRLPIPLEKTIDVDLHQDSVTEVARDVGRPLRDSPRNHGLAALALCGDLLGLLAHGMGRTSVSQPLRPDKSESGELVLR